jgi:hypothetical protein
MRPGMKRVVGFASLFASGAISFFIAAGCSSGGLVHFDADGGGGGNSGGGAIPPGTATSPTAWTTPTTPPTPTSDDPPPPDVCPTTTPITAADIDAEYTWEPPAPYQNVCVQSDIDAVKALLNSAGSVTFDAIKTALSPTCGACAFSQQSDAHWQVFVVVPGGDLDNSTASCFAQRSNPSCGQARFRFETCSNAACTDTDCGSDTRLQQCYAKAQTGACQSLTTAYAAACPNESTMIDACNVLGAIATSCGGGPDTTLDTTL